MKDETTVKIGFGLVGLYLVGWVTVVGLLGWVVVHFVSKLW